MRRNAAWLVARAPAQIRRIFLAIDPLPIRHTLRRYTAAQGRADLRAGFTGALVAFPQGIACAIIAGLPITYGLVSVTIASLLAVLFARSRFIVMGPTNGTSVLLLSALLASGVTQAADRAVLVALLVFMVGVFQIAAAYLNVGSLVAYISRSVIVGYISAAVVLIVTNQIGNLTGIEAPEAATLLGAIRANVLSLPRTDLPTALVALATAGVFFAMRRLGPGWATIVLTLLASAGLGLAASALGYPIACLPGVEASSWSLTLPELDFEGINQLASAALAIAFVGILEGSSIGKVLAARAGERLHSNQEVFAMGAANVGASLLGGMPVSGSPTRSMVGFTSGASTTVSSFVGGVLLVALALGLGQFLAYVPRASLAVIVITVATSLFNLRQIRFVVRSTSADAVVFAVTAGSALLLPLDSAVFLGTGTSIMLFLRQAGEPELVEYAFDRAGQLTAVGSGERRPLPEISIVHVEGSLFFGAAELLQEQIRRVSEDPNLRVLILRLKHAHHLDASAVLALEELVLFMRENGRALIVSGARKEVFRICKRTGLLDLVGRENFLR